MTSLSLVLLKKLLKDIALITHSRTLLLNHQLAPVNSITNTVNYGMIDYWTDLIPSGQHVVALRTLN